MKTPNNIIKDILSRDKEKSEPKHFPQPKYNKCNKGHTLVEVYNTKYNCYDWDCPTCINYKK